MESHKDGFVKTILFANKLLLKMLIAVITLCLILASVNLLIGVYRRIIEPPFLVLELPILFEGFSMVLIIAIGYELVKSLLIIITSENIPSLPIIQIAMIAVANKIITLDIKHTEPIILFGLAALITGLGLTYFFHKEKIDKQKAHD